MILTFAEIIDIGLMTFFIGFIFSDYFKNPNLDVLAMYTKKGFFDWENIKSAAIFVAPAIILHELGHKFVAILFGANATFHAAYTFLIIGALLKLARFPFIFFVPAYVSWSGPVTSFQAALIAFAGPFVNLMLWFGSDRLLKTGKYKKHSQFLFFSKKINLFLFIFNMIPIPGFDGYHVFKFGLSAIAGF